MPQLRDGAGFRIIQARVRNCIHPPLGHRQQRVSTVQLPFVPPGHIPVAAITKALCLKRVATVTSSVLFLETSKD